MRCSGRELSGPGRALAPTGGLAWSQGGCRHGCGLEALRGAGLGRQAGGKAAPTGAQRHQDHLPECRKLTWLADMDFSGKPKTVQMER